MKIVIDIPEEDYVYIAKKHCLPSCDDRTLRKNVYEMITNGTPLPKGHGRLIDADDVTDFEGHYITTDAPTIIEADKAESVDKNEPLS